MKKLIIILSAFSLLTACGANKNTSETAQQSNEVKEETINVTESTTRDSGICLTVNDTVNFESLEEFVDHVESDNLNDDFIPAYYADTGEKVIHENFTPLIPKYNEAKYELVHVDFNVSCYMYYLKSLDEDKYIDFSIGYDTYYHTYEEMVEAANANLAVPVENIETTVWGDTPALIQSIPFTDPVEYSIWAMIDENNRVYLSNSNMTPEELVACLNEFTFE